MIFRLSALGLRRKHIPSGTLLLVCWVFDCYQTAKLSWETWQYPPILANVFMFNWSTPCSWRTPRYWQIIGNTAALGLLPLILYVIHLERHQRALIQLRAVIWVEKSSQHSFVRLFWQHVCHGLAILASMYFYASNENFSSTALRQDFLLDCWLSFIWVETVAFIQA